MMEMSIYYVEKNLKQGIYSTKPKQGKSDIYVCFVFLCSPRLAAFRHAICYLFEDQ